MKELGFVGEVLDELVTFFTIGWKWILFAIAIGVLGYLKGCGDGMERVHAKYQAQAAKAEREARRASEDATASQEARNEQYREMQEALSNEAKKGNDSPVGPGVGAVLGELRKQQAAGDKAAR